MGDKGETRPRESGRTMQHRSHISRETMGGNENQDFGKVDHPTQAHMWGQWETIRKQDVGKADTASNTGAHMRGDNGREWGAMGDQGRQEIEKAGHH